MSRYTLYVDWGDTGYRKRGGLVMVLWEIYKLRNDYASYTMKVKKSGVKL